MLKDLPYENIFQEDFLTKILGKKLVKKLPPEKLAILKEFRFLSLPYVDHAKARKRMPDGTVLGAQRLLNGGYRIIKKAADWHDYTQRELKEPSIDTDTADILKQFHQYSNRELLEIIDLLQIVSQKHFIISYTQKTIYYNKELWESIENIIFDINKIKLKELFVLDAINSILKESSLTGELIGSNYYNAYMAIKNAIISN